GEGEAAVDGESLELVEDRIVRRVDRVAAVAAAERDHVDRRLSLLERVDLRGRRLRAEHVRAVEEERRPRRARRMPGVEGELVEVVGRRLDLAVVANLVPQAEEDVLDLPPDLRDRVQVAERQLVAGERDVDGLLRQSPLELRPLERRLLRRDRRLELLADRVERHPALAVADAAQRLLQLALPAEVANARLVELLERRSARNRPQRLGFESI